MTALAKVNSPYQMVNPTGLQVKLRLAISSQEQTTGLSGLSPKQFALDEGMLFVNKTMSPKKFWMPDTYFNLDIIFLDSNLKIVGIEKNVPAHPGKNEPPEIYRTKVYLSQFVLECKSGSKFSQDLKVGDVLKFTEPKSLSEIISKIRP